MTAARLRLLFSSNLFICKSGYGVQAGSLLPRLAELPEFGGQPGSREGRKNIAQFAWYGLSGASIHIEGFKVYPGVHDPYGNDVIGRHTNDFGANLVIPLIDAWVLKNVAQSIAPALYCPWFPVDHDPIPVAVLKGIEGAHMPLSYAKWGRDMLDKVGVPNTYLPHGLEPSIYRVLPREEVQRFRQQVFGLKEGDHLSLMVAANKGTPDRKWFQGQLRAWKEFAIPDHPNARLHIHTDPMTMHGGIDFNAMIVQLGLEGRVSFPDRYHYYMGHPPEYMALLFNAADVYLGAAMSEGFGIPIIESQGCGTPVVVTDFSAMPELVRHGEIVEVADMVWTPMNAYQAWPSVTDMTAKLNKLYAEWEAAGGDWPIERRQATSKLIHDEYSWDVVVRDYWAPLMTKLADEAPPLDARFQAASVGVGDFVRVAKEELAKDAPKRRTAPFVREPVTERSVEIPWLIANLGKPQRILDIGSADAQYVDALVATGAEVYLSDTRTVKLPKGAKGFVGSAAELPAEWTGMFDLVTCVSVLDHIGLDAYGNAADDTLLGRVVTELARVTAPGGRLLLTVPFGRDHVTTHPGGGQRVFGWEPLRDLFALDKIDGWGVRGARYWQLQGNEYIPVFNEDILNAEYGGWRANAVIALELVRAGERTPLMQDDEIRAYALGANGDGDRVTA